MVARSTVSQRPEEGDSPQMADELKTKSMYGCQSCRRQWLFGGGGQVFNGKRGEIKGGY